MQRRSNSRDSYSPEANGGEAILETRISRMRMARKEKILKSETLFKGKTINLHHLTMRLPSGKLFEDDIVERPSEVVIIPQISRNEIILTKQFRRGVGEILLELPSGKVKRGETVLTAARRELEEETKYKAKKLEKLTETLVAPSWSTMKSTFFLARELIVSDHPRPHDPDENIEVVRLTFKKALAKVASGEIKDTKTILGLLFAKRFFA